MFFKSPGALVQINGQTVPHESITINDQNYYFSSECQIIIPMSVWDSYGLEFFSNVQDSEVTVYIGEQVDVLGFNIGDLSLVFTGKIDTVNIDAVSFVTTIHCRDYASLFIDKIITKNFPNRTASEIATQLTEENGLTPLVTPTTENVGNYTAGFNLITNNMTEWDLLVLLARQENYNCFVQNKLLFFEPKPNEKSIPFLINYSPPKISNYFSSGNVTGLQFSRSISLIKNIEVIVKSYNPQTYQNLTGKAFVNNQPATSKRKRYEFNIPGLTATQAQKKAESLLEEIVQHQQKITIDMPGNSYLLKNTPILLSGTGTSLDQIYYIVSISRVIDVTTGFTMTINAQNKQDIIR